MHRAAVCLILLASLLPLSGSGLAAAELDIEAMLEQGPLLVEWAERVKSALPSEGLWAHLNYVDDIQRDMVFSAHGPYHEMLLTKFRRLIYGG